MVDPVTYSLADGIATITMDDGKANVMSQTMLAELAAAFDQAESDGSVVVLTGRPGRFSGGYDTSMFARSQTEVIDTIRAGGHLVLRMLGFPTPVLAACNGHAVAQGAFMLLGADVRIGTASDYKIGLNEVAIGLTIPHYGVEVARFRLQQSWFNHSTLTGALYPPTDAIAVGFLDRVVAAGELVEAAGVEAQRLAKLDMKAHYGTKLRVRKFALEAMRAGLDTEFGPSPQ